MKNEKPQYKIKNVTKLTVSELLKLEALEQEVFADGGLNCWTLPVIARYGHLFVLYRIPSHLEREVQGEGDIIGLATFICKEKTAFIIGLWVKEYLRNKGLGKRILTEAIADLKAQNIEIIELTVDEENEAALGLYNKLGFEFIDKLNDFYGPAQNRLLLKLKL